MILTQKELAAKTYSCPYCKCIGRSEPPKKSNPSKPAQKLSPSDPRRKYHLQVCPGISLQGPTDEEIETAVRGLPGGIPSWVILTKRKCHFMQAGGSFKEGFQLEYQEFSPDGHWEHINSHNIDGETVVRSLLWYAADDERWRSENQWKRLACEPVHKKSAPKPRRKEKLSILERWARGE